MDAENKALCYFYRHPPPGSGVLPSSYGKIADVVVKRDGARPSVGGVFKAVMEFQKARKVRGRRIGWRKMSVIKKRLKILIFIVPEWVLGQSGTIIR